MSIQLVYFLSLFKIRVIQNGHTLIHRSGQHPFNPPHRKRIAFGKLKVTDSYTPSIGFSKSRTPFVLCLYSSQPRYSSSQPASWYKSSATLPLSNNPRNKNNKRVGNIQKEDASSCQPARTTTHVCVKCFPKVSQLRKTYN